MSLIKPAQRKGKEFLNPIPTVSGVKGNTISVAWRFFTEKGVEREPKTALGPFVTDPASFALPHQAIRVTWLGHSTVLLELDERRILFDPMWGSRASFVSFAGPKRFFTPPLALAQLPKLDAIVLSHDHYDHLDASTWRALSQLPLSRDTPVFTSVGVAKYLRKLGYPGKINELDWTQTAPITNDVSLTCLPARHFSGRSLLNRNQTLWSAFAVTTAAHRVFFGADSGPFDTGFREIGDLYGPFDLTMLEIGAYGEQWPDIHMGPEHAINAHKLLQGKLLFPIHWGTFNLALHPWKEPAEKILALASKQNVPLLLPRPGLPTEAKAGVSYWWKEALQPSV